MLKIIGVDLDSTLIETHAVSKAAKDLGYPYTSKDVICWNFSNFQENLRKRIVENFMDSVSMCDDAIPIKGAQERIRSWSRFGHKIVLITARTSSIEYETVRMVERLFPEIKDINFVEYNVSKKETMIKKGIEIWCDDAPHGVLDSLEIGIPAWLISNSNTKYNWHVSKNPLLKGVVKNIAQIPDSL